MTLKIIAFDIGKNFALAHNGHGDTVVVEHKVFDGPRAHRQAKTMRYLYRRLKECKEAGITFDVAVYERPFARGIDATRSLWGLAGIIEAICTVHGMAVTDAENKQVKAWSKADGKKKEGMIAAAQAMGYVGDNEHEADAYCVLKFSEAFTKKSTPKTPGTMIPGKKK